MFYTTLTHHLLCIIVQCNEIFRQEIYSLCRNEFSYDVAWFEESDALDVLLYSITRIPM